MEADTEAPDAAGPGRSAVTRGSGTAASASATMAGGAVHHGTKCILGVAGKVEMVRHTFVEITLDFSARSALVGNVGKHGVRD